MSGSHPRFLYVIYLLDLFNFLNRFGCALSAL